MIFCLKGAWRTKKKNLFAVELVVFRYELLAVYDSYLERVSQKLGEKKNLTVPCRGASTLCLRDHYNRICFAVSECVFYVAVLSSVPGHEASACR